MATAIRSRSGWRSVAAAHRRRSRSATGHTPRSGSRPRKKRCLGRPKKSNAAPLARGRRMAIPDDSAAAFEIIPVRRLGRITFTTFLFTFIAARVLVILIMTRRIPDLFLYVGQTHVHHLNYGIFLLSAVGGLLVFLQR